MTTEHGHADPRVLVGLKALVESGDVPTGVRAHLLGEIFTIREQVDAYIVVGDIITALEAAGYLGDEHDREVAEKAWNEGVEFREVNRVPFPERANPYRLPDDVAPGHWPADLGARYHEGHSAADCPDVVRGGA